MATHPCNLINKEGLLTARSDSRSIWFLVVVIRSVSTHTFEVLWKIWVANTIVPGDCGKNANGSLHGDALLWVVVLVFRCNHRSRRFIFLYPLHQRA